MKKLVLISLTLFSLLPFAFTADKTNDSNACPDLNSLRSCSVMISAKPESVGSGIIKTRKIGEYNYHFVWTAGHVIDESQIVRTIIEPSTGKPKVVVEYPDTTISRFIVQDGGYTDYRAQVIKHSDSKHGEDLALLLVRAHDVLDISTQFSDDSVPTVGSPIWHIGSMSGVGSPNATVEGLLSNVGIVRHAKLFDQVTVPSIPGCSGGGVFLKSNGKCIGLMLEGISVKVHSINYIRPTREIRAWAKKVNCAWAIDDSVPVPSLEEIRKGPVNVEGIEQPAQKDLLGGLIPFIF
jgi:S1-C subfamily serine protease